MTRRSHGVAKRLWTELTRPRGPVRHRFYRGGRRSKAGVALLMTITSVMLMAILVSEIAFAAATRAQVASQYRDEVAAEMLARSGLQFHYMILIASATIGNNPMIQNFAQMFGSNANELWQAIPFIDTRFLRLVIVDDGADEGDLEQIKAQGGLSAEQIEESRTEGSSLTKRSFLDFDGDFNSTVRDIERLINVRQIQATSLGELLQSPAGAQLNALFLREDYHEWLNRNNLVREELIANLADWTDVDDTRLYQGGSEDALYDRGDDERSYRSKNAPFDTREEIRLVEGWHLDGVWERVGRHLTVYGSGKVNVNTATREVLFGILSSYAAAGAGSSDLTAMEAVDAFLMLRGAPMSDGGIYISQPSQFVQIFASPPAQLGIAPYPLRPEVEQAIATKSQVFRITSVGEVGDARAEAEMVVDFTGGGAGRIIYWNVR